MRAAPTVEAFITRWESAGGSERANYKNPHVPPLDRARRVKAGVLGVD